MESCLLEIQKTFSIPKAQALRTILPILLRLLMLCTSIYPFKIVLVGPSSVGKTSISNRFAKDQFQLKTSATAGAAYVEKEINIPGENKMKLQIWDTAGQERYRAIANIFYKNARVAILVYDVTCRASFQSLKSWAQEVKTNGPQDIVLAVVGNKVDLLSKSTSSTTESEGNVVLDEQGRDYAAQLGAIFKTVSAKENLRVSELFLETVREVKFQKKNGQRKQSISFKAKSLLQMISNICYSFHINSLSIESAIMILFVCQICEIQQKKQSSRNQANMKSNLMEYFLLKEYLLSGSFISKVLMVVQITPYDLNYIIHLSNTITILLMQHLNILNYATEGKSIKVILVGPSGVGKTSLSHQFVKNEFHQRPAPTSGALFLERDIQHSPENEVKLQIWDTAGQERYRSMARIFYKEAKIAILVYDVTCPDSFQKMKEWAQEVKNTAPKNVLLAVIGNKTDLLPDRIESLDSFVSEKDGRQFAMSIGAFFKTMSAKDNVQVQEIFVEMAKKVKLDKEKAAQKKADFRQLRISLDKKKRGCC